VIDLKEPTQRATLADWVSAKRDEGDELMRLRQEFAK